MSYQLKAIASDTVQKALANIGRTEDVKFSPDNSKLAIAGFHNNKILIIGVTIEASTPDRLIHLTDCFTITSDSLKSPHGLCFFDSKTLGVANRDGEIILFELPEPSKTSASYKLTPIQSLGADPTHRIKTPGSLIATRIGLDLYEILVCNNYTHKITRHILDAQANYSPLKNEILLSNTLNIPDGIAISPSHCWIAISNHDTHNVLLFRDDLFLGPDSEPRGSLENIKYPHGLCFAGGDNFILLADAGTPYVHIYAKNSEEWDGEHKPVISITVMNDTTYMRGSYHPQEGGPKGIDVSSNMKTFVTTCHQQPLAFFDLEKILNDHPLPTNVPSNRATYDDTHALQLSRHALIRELVDANNTSRQQIAQLDVEHAKKIESIYSTRSWRITAPLRLANSTLRSLKSTWMKFKIEKGWI